VPPPAFTLAGRARYSNEKETDIEGNYRFTHATVVSREAAKGQFTADATSTNDSGTRTRQAIADVPLMTIPYGLTASSPRPCFA